MITYLFLGSFQFLRILWTFIWSDIVLISRYCSCQACNLCIYSPSFSLEILWVCDHLWRSGRMLVFPGHSFLQSARTCCIYLVMIVKGLTLKACHSMCTLSVSGIICLTSLPISTIHWVTYCSSLGPVLNNGTKPFFKLLGGVVWKVLFIDYSCQLYLVHSCWDVKNLEFGFIYLGLSGFESLL